MEHASNKVYLTISPTIRLKSSILKMTDSSFMLSKAEHAKANFFTKLTRKKKNKSSRLANFHKSYTLPKFTNNFRLNRKLLIRYVKPSRNKIRGLYSLNYSRFKSLLITSIRLSFKKRTNKYIINRIKTKLKRKKSTAAIPRNILVKFKRSIALNRFPRKRTRITKEHTLNLRNSKVSYNSFTQALATPRVPQVVISNTLTIDQVKYPIVRSLETTSLRIFNSAGSIALSYISLFLDFKLTVLNFRFNSEKFLIRKLIYSFLKPNEAKKSIMNRRKRIFTTRFYKRVHSSNILSKPLLERRSLRSKLTFKQYLFNQKSGSLARVTSSSSRGQSELFLPRVKFKPGYQRIWRQSRSAIAESINLKYIYQKQMTKYMTRLSRRVNNYSFSMSESSLDKAILYSRLLPDLKTVNCFMDAGLVYLNSWKINNLGTFVITGDFIQITIGKWLSIYFRWLTIWAKQNKNKFKKLIFRKGLASSYKLMKQKKQRSKHVPLWIYNSRFEISDIKPNYEVDYFTMSSFVLYEPLLIDYYTPDDLPDHRHYIYRLYNWKYIT